MKLLTILLFPILSFSQFYLEVERVGVNSTKKDTSTVQKVLLVTYGPHLGIATEKDTLELYFLVKPSTKDSRITTRVHIDLWRNIRQLYSVLIVQDKAGFTFIITPLPPYKKEELYSLIIKNARI